MEMKNWPAGFRMTRPRLLVYRALEAADTALDARELYRRISGGGMALSTVYRVLAAFEEQGLVTRTTIMGGETALYALCRGGHAHYAICLGCRRQIPLRHCPLENLPLDEEADGFLVTGHRLELYGYCRDCKKRHRQDH